VDCVRNGGLAPARHGKLPRGAAAGGGAAREKSAVGGREAGGHAAVASGAARDGGTPLTGAASGSSDTYRLDCLCVLLRPVREFVIVRVTN